MDIKTVDAYNTNAQEHAQRHSQTTPTRLHQLTETFFKKGEPTLDLGCGIGRDSAWLKEKGYNVEGVDASEGMLKLAVATYTHILFSQMALPQLGFEENNFSNIYCCAVLMHIPRSELVSSVMSILRILKPNGKLVLSYRDGRGEEDGRLFETYHPGQIAQLFESLGGKVLLQENDGIWKNFVIEKSDVSKREGINQIQDIITRDKKVATYKFALLRALCEISRYESHAVTWYREADMVLVPMKRIAVRWVYYYWPLVKQGIRQTTSKNMAFESELENLPYKLSDFALLKVELEDLANKDLNKLLKKVGDTIHKGPVTFSGGGETPVFNFISATDASVYAELRDKEFGTVAVPLSLWRDINLFSHWIEDSLSIQWAELSEKINKDGQFAKHLDLITKSVQEDERTTYLIRKLFNKKDIRCVWTDKKLETFAVDHMIPWSVWRNNDLWNLLPAHPKVNNQKRDFLPSPALVRKRFDAIKGFWEVYMNEHPVLFEKQIQRGLGVSAIDAFKKAGEEALEQSLIRVNLLQGGVFWDFNI